MKIFENSMTKIYLADCLDALNDIQDNSIDLIFADPPYNIGKKFSQFKDSWKTEKEYIEWCYKWLSLCLNKLKDNGSLYVMASTQSMPYIDIWLRERMTILSRIIWHYDSSGVQAKKYYGSLYEPILFAVKNNKSYTFNSSDIEIEAKTGAKRKLIDYRKEIPTPYKTTKVPGNTWYFPRVRYRMEEYENHPSQKPEALLERIIRASTNEGDLVLDPFGGTFSTSAVAQKLNRKSISIEFQEEYLKIGLRRLGIATEYRGEKLCNTNKISYGKIVNLCQKLENSMINHSILKHHSFTEKIISILKDEFGDNAIYIFENSPILGYLNIKTKSAERGSKSRGSFANHYALYVIIEDYISKGYLGDNLDYSKYEGAKFTDLFRRQRELPFGSKLQTMLLIAD